jgi:hypothetical protein
VARVYSVSVLWPNLSSGYLSVYPDLSSGYLSVCPDLSSGYLSVCLDLSSACPIQCSSCSSHPHRDYLGLPRCYKTASSEHSLFPSPSCIPSLEFVPSVEENTLLSGNTPHHSPFILCRYHPDQSPGAHLVLHTWTTCPRLNIMRRWLKTSDHPCHPAVVGFAQRASRSSASTQ